MAVDIDSLQIEIEATSSDAASKIERLATALTNLKSSAKGGAGLTTTTKQLQALSNAAKLINGTNLDSKKIQQFVSAMNSLSGIQRASGLSSTISALKKLPEISKSPDGAHPGKFAKQMDQVASAMRPLATEMQRVANGFSAFPIRIQKIIQSNTGLAASNNKAAKSFGVLGTGISSAQAKFGIYLIAFRQLASVMSDWVRESNDYVENLNLFTVAMGEYAESAKAYAEEVQALTGIDSSEWMRNQGVFMQMAAGFGVASDSAARMSKNLTQLGYDISSFYNISIEEAMQKLQSGLAGEIEPLRRLGYAIDVASLEQVALNHGITESVNAMTQAEKSQLRYIAIMEQSSNAMGDLSRTIQTPANAIRILNQQIVQLRRALGNMLIPILQKVIPWVQAFVEVLTEAAQAIANFLGFELPTIDYSGLEGVSGGATDASDALDDAAEAAKKLQDYTLGIDELNIISPAQNAAAGGGAGVSGGDLGLDLPEYDFLGDLEKNVDNIKEAISGITDEVLAIGAGFAAWKIAPKVLSWFKDLKNGRFSKIDKLAAGIGLVVTGFTLEWQGAYDIGYSGPNVQNVLKTLIGSALGIAGSLLIFGTGPLGWTIGIVAALSVAIAGITIGYNRGKIDAEIKKRFGEIELTVEEAKDIAEGIMSSPLSIQLDMYVDAKTTATDAIERYLASSENFSYLVWKVSVGFEVDEAELNSSLDAMTSDAQSFLNAQRETYTLAINIGFSDEGIKTEMANFVNTYFSKSQSEMERLGTELKQTMLNALADGIIDELEMKAINDLQSEVNQMMQKVADAEYKAKLTNAVYELDGNLSYESVKAVGAELQVLAQNQLDTLEQTHLDALAVIELKYQTDGNYEEYTAAIENEMQTYFANQAQISATAFEPLIGKFNSAFSDALTKAQPAFDRPISDLLDRTFHQFTTDETGVLVGDSISDFMRSVDERWKLGFASLDVTPEVKAALGETLAALEPSIEQLQKIQDDARAAGTAVPKYVSEGLHDYNMLLAISGDMDAINYLLGEKLSTDPNFLEALETATDAGYNINQAVANGLLNNLQVKENADGTVTLINDSIGQKVLEVTPQLVETMNALGIDLSNGVLAGAETQMEANKGSWLDWAIWPWNWFKEKNEINSPSKKFAELGGYLSDGLVEGIQGKKEGLFSEIGDWAQGIIGKVMDVFGINSPSKEFKEIGEYSMQGLINGFNEMPFVTETFSSELDAMKISATAFSSEVYTIIDTTLAFFLTSIATAQTENQRFTDAMTTMYRSMASQSNSAIQSIISSLNSIPRNITTVHTIVTQSVSGGKSTKAFASGGFPETGQMFLAREAGPELVGTIGSRTAVANNAQIVEGIAAGVSDANQAQNALLREQNELLRAILAKEGVVNIDGKQIKKAYDRASRNSGASIMVGGVVG